MTKTEIETGTLDILISFLGQDFSEESTRNNVSDWDSLQHMQIIFALEERFEIEFTEEEIPRMNSCEVIVGSIANKYES
jgi:acyl carrier protein